MKQYLIGGSVGLAALGALLLLPADINPVPEPVEVSDIRAVRIKPDSAIDLAEACPAGSYTTEKYIVCLTDEKADLTDEVKTKDLDDKDQVSLMLCDVEQLDDEGKKTGIYKPEVSYYMGKLDPPKDCQIVCPDLLLPGLSMANVETGIEACLRVACAPCAISGGSWGACPHCLSDLTPSCAEACPAPEDLEP